MKFRKDVYPHDFIVVRGGVKCKPPKYYDSIYDKEEEKKIDQGIDKVNHMDIIKYERERLARKSENNLPWRLEAREVVKKARINLLRREMENGKASF